ncbi:MAG: coenzyme F420-0:L-glutamate ligase [Clostridiales bacterium]|uniref:coenzyme F420-0:L-glutamate ligase n=1 Tax=Evtepia sp. TaxID=2773933 RepID=UPI002986FEDB|nr:coenzyme F420-0:L-glutamate ligase [Evtepia sp.]MDD7288575.1 coenzyme F420-0:L-glutamate ligase [Clostridiales bacterium]MDY3992488.1 coenzyme F420-0:L-glutamate ligase [Evtepia sp.]MDY4429924.1 coenzyme F420-0:L-glutamate ligase [Evtepia sp.]
MAGVISRGIQAPIIREGDDIVEIVVNSVYASEKEDNYTLKDRDIIAVTESVVARAQGNYVTVDQVAQDIRNKFGTKKLGLVFPILSRNRFSMCLKGIARAVDEVVILFSYPNDEVGNPLMARSAYVKHKYSEVTSYQEKDFVETFGSPVHPFTGVNYLDFYRQVIESEGAKATFLFSNDCRYIATACDDILCCDIHTRNETRDTLKALGKNVCTLADVMSAPVDGSGYHDQYGLLGSNKATEEKLKLFPRNCQPVVDGIQARILADRGIHVEAMVYGDGAFKDPVGGIWELADPVVSPAYTAGLSGRPNELKLKYLADNDFADLSGEELKAAIRKEIQAKNADLVGDMSSEGTTPRQYTDLLGSLCDLTSGSGDKGTPFIVIQNYFKNYAE